MNINKKGFTLIELLIVIAVMAILTTVVFVALNPLARFQDARNNRRNTDVTALISALKLGQIDNGGSYYSDIEDATVGTAYMIGKGTDASTIECLYPTVTLDAQCIDFSYYVEVGGYLPDVPIDPNAGANGADEEYTGYYFIKNANGSITIGSCYEEAGTAGTPREISVKR